MAPVKVGPFEYEKIQLIEQGSARTRPNDFANCHVHIKSCSPWDTNISSSNDNSSNLISHALNCDINIIISHGSTQNDCSVELCLQTMTVGETSRFKIFSPSLIPRISAAQKINVDQVDEDRASIDFIGKTNSGLDFSKATNTDGGNSRNVENSIEVQPLSNDATRSFIAIEITLISFVPALDTHHISATEALDRARLLKEIGVECFKRGDLALAFYKFCRAIKYLATDSVGEFQGGTGDRAAVEENNGHLVPEVKRGEQISARKSLWCQCYLNISACHLQTGSFTSALKTATQALSIEPLNVKGLFRRAQALIQLNEYELAKDDLESALRAEPTNSAVLKSLAGVRARLKCEDDKMRAALTKLFK